MATVATEGHVIAHEEVETHLTLPVESNDFLKNHSVQMRILEF